MCPRSYWDNFENHKKYVKWVENELNIKNPSDWYKVSTKVEKRGKIKNKRLK